MDGGSTEGLLTLSCSRHLWVNAFGYVLWRHAFVCGKGSVCLGGGGEGLGVKCLLLCSPLQLSGASSPRQALAGFTEPAGSGSVHCSGFGGLGASFGIRAPDVEATDRRSMNRHPKPKAGTCGPLWSASPTLFGAPIDKGPKGGKGRQSAQQRLAGVECRRRQRKVWNVCIYLRYDPNLPPASAKPTGTKRSWLLLSHALDVTCSY